MKGSKKVTPECRTMRQALGIDTWGMDLFRLKARVGLLLTAIESMSGTMRVLTDNMSGLVARMDVMEDVQNTVNHGRDEPDAPNFGDPRSESSESGEEAAFRSGVGNIMILDITPDAKLMRINELLWPVPGSRPRRMSHRS